MKKLILPALVIGLMMGFASCQKCVECDNCPLGVSGDACVEDFNSKEDYEAAVANAEALGCDCKEKLSGK